MKRFRHLRSSQAIRDQSAEVTLQVDQFILPLFIVEGKAQRSEIPSMTDVYHLSVDEAVKKVEFSLGKGINKFLFFGVVDPSLKDDLGTAAYAENNLISRAIREIKNQFGKDI